MFRRLGMILILAMLACSDIADLPPEPEPQLALVEARALYSSIQSLIADSTLDIIAVTGGVVAACPLGGEIAIAGGSVEETVADTSWIRIELRVTPSDCSVVQEDFTFTLDGHPDLVVTLNFGIIKETFGFLGNGTMLGELSWKLDDRSGTCPIDLAMTTTQMDAKAQQLVAGTMCGHEVEFIDVVSPVS